MTDTDTEIAMQNKEAANSNPFVPAIPMDAGGDAPAAGEGSLPDSIMIAANGMSSLLAPVISANPIPTDTPQTITNTPDSISVNPTISGPAVVSDAAPELVADSIGADSDA
jgi:hypothetical protein